MKNLLTYRASTYRAKGEFCVKKWIIKINRKFSGQKNSGDLRQWHLSLGQFVFLPILLCRDFCHFHNQSAILWHLFYLKNKGIGLDGLWNLCHMSLNASNNTANQEQQGLFHQISRERQPFVYLVVGLYTWLECLVSV